MAPSLHVVVLAAGEGKRLRGRHPKVLMPLWGRPAAAWPVDAAKALLPDGVVVVGGEHVDALGAALEGRGVSLARQEQPLGTGHAVLAARKALESADGELLVLNGDCPLVTADLLEQLVAAHRAHGGPLTFLSMELDDPTGYGRVIRDTAGKVTAIVEEKEATPEQRAVREVNAGLWVLDLPAAWDDLSRIGSDNRAGEIYLTDLVAMRVAAGDPVVALCWSCPEDVLGFNDQQQLSEVRAILHRRILQGHLANGVEIVDPDSTFIDADVIIEPGARILPCTMIEGRVSIAFGCDVGPFAHLRDGSVLMEGSKVGNFTETKKSVLGPVAKAGHLTYLGDAEVGAGTNIGAGTITANYDGRNKHPTQIGKDAFIGSGTVIVAPATVGDGALTGAGAIVTAHTTIGTGEVWVGLPARLHRSSSSAGERNTPTEEPST
jgi:bifunctional UDP-N-acetylglucosamine pyrophosphorylase/glucosamine-1-phosphate N-acetyltransferase